MTKWKQDNAGDLQYRKTKIRGYDVTIIKQGEERKDVWFSLIVPMGKTPEDIKMFDEFVYHNNDLYNTKTEVKLLNNFRKFVDNWKN